QVGGLSRSGGVDETGSKGKTEAVGDQHDRVATEQSTEFEHLDARGEVSLRGRAAGGAWSAAVVIHKGSCGAHAQGRPFRLKKVSWTPGITPSRRNRLRPNDPPEPRAK